MSTETRIFHNAISAARENRDRCRRWQKGIALVAVSLLVAHVGVVAAIETANSHRFKQAKDNLARAVSYVAQSRHYTSVEKDGLIKKIDETKVAKGESSFTWLVGLGTTVFTLLFGLFATNMHLAEHHDRQLRRIEAAQDESEVSTILSEPIPGVLRLLISARVPTGNQHGPVP